MTRDGRVYDGANVMVGQDADTHPSYLPSSLVSSSINRTFRGGVNSTRPPFVELTLEDAEDNDGAVSELRSKNIQGMMAYAARTVGAYDGLLVAAGGSIYFIAIVSDTGFVYRIHSGYNPYYFNTWFVQAENRVYIQNGQQNPLVWEGDPLVPCQTLNPFQKKVPVGTVMAYIHGRLFVANKFNEIYASDIIFGNNATDTTDTENFTETEYWAEGGSFLTPAALGNITGMFPMPSIGTNSRGQGELVVFCEKGAFAMPVSIPRAEWNNAPMQNITLTGRGSLSPWGLTGVNNQVWYRSSDGWAFYSNSQAEFQRSFAYRKLSREVNRWVDQDTPSLIRYASAAYWNNYILMTVSPYVVFSSNENHGDHRPHRGFVVLDLDPASSASPDANLTFRWNGIWTGINPIQVTKAFINNVERCFAFSYDNDGVNRLYEVKRAGTNDYVNGKNVKIISQFTTKRFNFAGDDLVGDFMLKEINGGELWASRIKEKVGLHVEYRPDSYPCWSDLQPYREFHCDYCTPEQENCEPAVSQEVYKRFKFPTPSKKDCREDGGTPRVGTAFQLRVTMVGAMNVDRFRISATANIADPPNDNCEDECRQIKCCSNEDFELYSLT
jgi:hypothetical protein